MFNMVPFGRRRRGGEVSEFENSFDSLMSNFFSDVMDFADAGFKTDIKENEDSFIIEAELPGLQKEDINVEIDENNLIISATNESVEEEKEENFIRRERRTGTYQRVFSLDNVKDDEIEAEYEDGILKLTLPKEKPGRTRKRVIDIN